MTDEQVQVLVKNFEKLHASLEVKQEENEKLIAILVQAYGEISANMQALMETIVEMDEGNKEKLLAKIAETRKVLFNALAPNND